MHFGIIFIGLTLVSTVSAYFTACMRENAFAGTRCGTCLESGCGDYRPYKCEFYDQTAEEVDFDTLFECSTYVNASTQVTTPEMQDSDTGVPHFGYAATMLFYSASLAASDPNLLKSTPAGFNAIHVQGVPSCFKNLTTPSECKTGVAKIKTGTLTGKDLQNCGNAYAFQCGMKAVETGLCAYVSDKGVVGKSFCESRAAEAIFGTVNNFANKYIEKPIVKIAAKIEDAAVSVAKHVGHWFMSLF